MQRVFDKLNAYRVFFSINTAMTVVAACMVLGLSVHVLPVVVAVAALQYTYALDSLLDPPTQKTKGADSRTALKWLIGISAVTLVACAFVAPALAGVLAVTACFLSAYNVGAPRAWVKRVPYLKAPYVAFFFAFFTVAIPSMQAGIADSWAAIVVFVYFAMATTAKSIAYDMADVESDRRNGYPTVPVRHGRRASAATVHALLVGAVLVAAAAGHPALAVHAVYTGLVLVAFAANRRLGISLNLASGVVLVVLVALLETAPVLIAHA